MKSETMNSHHTIEEATQRLIDRLRNEYHPLKVILFGSHARGSASTGSDIDLLIVKETQERFIDRWVRVRGILSDSSRTFAIETLVLTPGEIDERVRRGDQFIAEILEHGRLLYAA